MVDLKTLPERLRSLGERVIVAVASPADLHTEEVIERSVSEGFADFILTVVDGKQTIAEQLATKHRNKSRLSMHRTTTLHAKPYWKCVKDAPMCS